MYLRGIASAFPEISLTQVEAWERVQDCPAVRELRPRSREILDKVLNGDGGIERRYYSVCDLPALFEMDAGELNQTFELHAPRLAGQALGKALAQAETQASELDALIICTCTGYLCPGVTSHVAQQLGLRQDIYLQDIVGLGCGAAIPTLRSAAGFLAANPAATVGVVAVEICSAAFYIDNDPGVLISLCLFGDGASASIWRGEHEGGAPAYRITGFDTLHIPEQREKVRFLNSKGYLKNKLHRTVPQLSGDAVLTLYQRRGMAVPNPHIISHAGGRDVLLALQERLPVDHLPESWELLREAGNLSSPSVLVALEKHLNSHAPKEDLWLTSFGAGFACHSAEATLVGV